MSLLYSDSIVQPIFIEPFLTLHANKLCVLSEHASPNMASWLLKTYEERKLNGISLELIIGDTLNCGIDINTHEAFKELQEIVILQNGVSFHAVIYMIRQIFPAQFLFG